MHRSLDNLGVVRRLISWVQKGLGTVCLASQSVMHRLFSRILHRFLMILYLRDLYEFVHV